MASTNDMLKLALHEHGFNIDDCAVLRKGQLPSRPFEIIEGIKLDEIYHEDAKNLVLVHYTDREDTREEPK